MATKNDSSGQQNGSDASTAKNEAGQNSSKQDGSKRKPSDQRENAFNFLAWAVEGATGIAEELRYNDLGLTEEFWDHLYAARREGLFAARALLDSLIERTEESAVKEEERAKRKERRGGIKIDF